MLPSENEMWEYMKSFFNSEFIYCFFFLLMAFGAVFVCFSVNIRPMKRPWQKALFLVLIAFVLTCTNVCVDMLKAENTANSDIMFKDGYRISSSSGVEAEESDACCSDFIDMTALPAPFALHLGGIEWDGSNPYNNLVLYDENKSRIHGETFRSWLTNTECPFDLIIDDVTNAVTIVYRGKTFHNTAIKYIRVSGKGSSANAVAKLSAMTIDNSCNCGDPTVPPNYEDRFVALDKTDEQLQNSVNDHTSRIESLEKSENFSIPEYWVEHLEEKADTIQRAMETAGRNKSAFLWYTDAHWEYTNAKVSPLLLHYLSQNTPMNKVNFGGDIVSDPSELTHEKISYVYEWRKLIADLPNHHSVIGNHDNLHEGRNDSDVSNLVYSFLIAPEESADMVMGDDFCYYIDNPCEKTRYLYLDSGRIYLDDKEARFIIDSLTSVPDGWHVVVISHIWWQYISSSEPDVGSTNEHMQVVLDLLDAYNARESGSVTMSYTPQSYDFSACGGKVEFCIGGHIHVDYDFTSAGGIPVIITASDTNQERNNNETEDCGVIGTITESAVFGIIADYTNHKITVVGVGRGTSREITY